MKKVFSFVGRMFAAFLLSFSCALIFCASFMGVLSLTLFGGLFIATLIGTFD